VLTDEKEENMPVKVIVKRKIQISKPEELLPFVQTLRSKAKKQPGYIDGRTWRSIDNPDECMVISTWETHGDWTKWFQSSERREIQGAIDSLIGEKTFYDVYEPMS